VKDDFASISSIQDQRASEFKNSVWDLIPDA
jgi:hypothetical protein